MIKKLITNLTIKKMMETFTVRNGLKIDDKKMSKKFQYENILTQTTRSVKQKKINLQFPR